MWCSSSTAPARTGCSTRRLAVRMRRARLRRRHGDPHQRRHRRPRRRRRDRQPAWSRRRADAAAQPAADDARHRHPVVRLVRVQRRLGARRRRRRRPGAGEHPPRGRRGDARLVDRREAEDRARAPRSGRAPVPWRASSRSHRAPASSATRQPADHRWRRRHRVLPRAVDQGRAPARRQPRRDRRPPRRRPVRLDRARPVRRLGDRRRSPTGCSSAAVGELLKDQIVASGSVLVFSARRHVHHRHAIEKTIGMRVEPDDEYVGLDRSQHAESAYQP